MNTNYIIDLLKAYAPKLATAIIVLLLGLWVISLLTKMVKRIMEKKEVDSSLQGFLKGLFNISLKVLLIISVISMAGIETTSFIAILGAAGLAIGFALQGSLANFAGGVLILILKPYRVGDYISGGGHSGTVEEIQVFHTVLKTPQNQRIVIPNGLLSNSSVINYSYEPTRRLDLVFGISYNDDIDKARKIIQDIIDQDSRCMKEPAPQILVEALADSSVNIKLRVWAKQEDFWNLNFDMIETVKKSFDKEGVTIPYPHRQVYLQQQNAS